MIISWADLLQQYPRFFIRSCLIRTRSLIQRSSSTWALKDLLHYVCIMLINPFFEQVSHLTTKESKLSLYSFLWGTVSGFLPLIKIGVLRQDINPTNISICFNVPISVFAYKIWRLKVISINPYFIPKSLKAKLQIIHHSCWKLQFLSILIQLEIPLKCYPVQLTF